MSVFTGKSSSKVTPENRRRVEDATEYEVMEVVRLHTLLKRYGGERHPKVESYETFKKRGELVEWRFVPSGSTAIYISHEWTGTDHPDPDGTHMYHLLLLLERLRDGEISSVNMDFHHELVYKQHVTTTAEEWKCLLGSGKTYIWYDGFSVPRSRREDGFRSIPSYIRKCDFMIILAPGCTHFDRIDPITKWKTNLCYRTYRLRARCVFEMICAFLTTRGGEKVRPTLLVKSGTGTPNWISPLSFVTLTVGNSLFECCNSNHTTARQCYRPVALDALDRMVQERAHSLFVSKNYMEARFVLCERNHVCEGLIDERSKKIWKSQYKFKNDLQWNDTIDGKWIDREGIPLLIYTIGTGCIQLVREILEEIGKISDIKQRALCINRCMPKQGCVSLGLPGYCNSLHGAMFTSSPKIVSLLLEHGADPFSVDIMGNDAFMFACIGGRVENASFWCKRFPDWNIERKNTVIGASALTMSVFVGNHGLKIAKFLLRYGASPTATNDRGSSILMSLCANEDCDTNLVRFLLQVFLSSKSQVNLRRRAKTRKWRVVFSVARTLLRLGLSSSKLVEELAFRSGATALHHAVRRGDVDVVNILLLHGADPSIKNDLGKSPVDYCDAFPELRGALKRVIKQRIDKSTLSRKSIITVHRRNSTATDMKFPMYLIPLVQLQRLYGRKESRRERIEAHQVLKDRQELVRWEDLPIDAHIIFVSHEWVGWNHPDPHGIQLKTFLSVMKQLASNIAGRVEMNVFHTLIYEDNYVTLSGEWKEMLSTAYVWFDWASMPQPSACPPGTSEEKKKEMEADLGNAVKSIPAYVEKADFVAIVAPGCLHVDRRDPETKLRTKTCYRTYRSRGWCVLEMFASYLSRVKSHPSLLIRSDNEMPEWVRLSLCLSLSIYIYLSFFRSQSLFKRNR